MRYVFIVLVFAFLFSGAFAAGYYYYFLIPEKVERKVLEGIASLGLEDFKYESIEKDNEKISIRGVTIDKDGFSTIDEINIHFSLSQIFFKSDQARSIVIKGMKLSGSLPETNKPDFDGWTDSATVFSNIKNLPAKTVVIDKGSADLNSSVFGGIKLNYTLQLNRKSQDAFNFVGKLSTKQNLLAFHSKISGEVSDIGTNLSMETEQISATLPHLKIRRGTAKIDYKSTQASTYAADVHLASMVWNDLPLSNVKGNITFSGQSINTALKGSTFGQNSIPWTLSYERNEAEKHDFRAILTPDRLGDFLTFLEESKGINLAPLPPLILDVAAKISFTGSSNGTNSSGEIVFFDGGLEHNVKGAFSSDDSLKTINGYFAVDTPQTLKSTLSSVDFSIPINGKFALSDFWSSPELSLHLRSQISSGILDFDVFKLSKVSGLYSYQSEAAPPSNISFKFNLPLKVTIPHKGYLSVQPYNTNNNIFGIAKLDIYGGSIQTEGAVMRDSILSKKHSLVVEDINIAQLFADAGFDGVFVSGLLGGIVPIHFKNGEARVNGGILQSQGSGIIKITPQLSGMLFPGNTERTKKIRASLENYHYEFFEIRFDGDLASGVLMTVSAIGRNPELGQKEPVDLNLQIETKISTLFQNLLK